MAFYLKLIIESKDEEDVVRIIESNDLAYTIRRLGMHCSMNIHGPRFLEGIHELITTELDEANINYIT